MMPKSIHGVAGARILQDNYRLAAPGEGDESLLYFDMAIACCACEAPMPPCDMLILYLSSSREMAHNDVSRHARSRRRRSARLDDDDDARGALMRFGRSPLCAASMYIIMSPLDANRHRSPPQFSLSDYFANTFIRHARELTPYLGKPVSAKLRLALDRDILRCRRGILYCR